MAIVFHFKHVRRRRNAGLKISFTGPSDKMSDDCEFGSDMCMMMSDPSVQFGSE
jgi:hypothetical protein